MSYRLSTKTQTQLTFSAMFVFWLTSDNSYSLCVTMCKKQPFKYPINSYLAKWFDGESNLPVGVVVISTGSGR